MTVTVPERIIWSADVPDEKTLMARLDSMKSLVVVKIDRNFVTDTGLGVVDRLNDRGLRVFDDGKIVEIPSKVAETPMTVRNCLASLAKFSNMSRFFSSPGSKGWSVRPWK